MKIKMTKKIVSHALKILTDSFPKCQDVWDRASSQDTKYSYISFRKGCARA